jgi:multiple sugar transport system substrate-binding protein
MQRKSGSFLCLFQFPQLPPRWLPWSPLFLAAALAKKRCLELCALTKCWSFERLKVPDSFFWAKLLAAGFFGLLGSGCGSRSTTVSSAAKAHAGKVITVSCPGKPATEVVERYSSPWSLQSGARVAVVSYDAQTGPEAGPAADLWVVAPADMPHWAAAGKLAAVPAALAAEGAPYGWENILRIYRKLLIWDARPYALPLLGDELLCFYREDLFQDAAHRQAFRQKHHADLPAAWTGPSTWEEFMAIAGYFHNQERPGLSHPCASLPPLPSDDDALDHEFYTVVVPFAHRAVRIDERSGATDDEVFSFHYDLTSGAARIDTPGFVHGLEILQHLQALRASGTSPEPAAAFERGEAVLCLASPSWINRFQESAPVRGKFGFCRPPGSRHLFDYRTGDKLVTPVVNYVPYLGASGWLSAVPRMSAQPEAAFELAAALSSPQMSREIVIEPAWGGGVYRREQLETRTGFQSFGLGDRTEALVDTLREITVHSQIKNPLLKLRIPDARAHQEALDAELRRALVQGKNAQQALADAAARWRNLDRRKDDKTRRTDYRLSLGLERIN